MLHQSYEEVYARTVALFEKVGLDLNIFEKESVKSIEQLVTEVWCGEAILTEIGKPGCLKRIAWSSKLIICTYLEYLVEMFRIYPSRNARIIKKSLFVDIWLEAPNWTLSETALKTEDPLVVILRGLREELGIIPLQINELRCLNPGETWIDTHASSVYHGVITENHTTWYEWKMEDRHPLLLPDSIMREDGDVELHLKWQPYNFTLASNG